MKTEIYTSAQHLKLANQPSSSFMCKLRPVTEFYAAGEAKRKNAQKATNTLFFIKVIDRQLQSIALTRSPSLLPLRAFGLDTHIPWTGAS